MHYVEKILNEKWKPIVFVAKMSPEQIASFWWMKTVENGVGGEDFTWEEALYADWLFYVVQISNFFTPEAQVTGDHQFALDYQKLLL